MVPENVRTGAVILAAGGSSRFGAEAKALAVLDGRSLVRIAVDTALEADSFAAVAVVEGAVDLGAVLPASVERLHNPDWVAGQATSLAVALDWADRCGFGAVVVGLVDQPGVVAEAWRRLAAVTDSPITIATYDGVRGNPVRLDRSVWPLLPRTGDEGARVVVRGRPDLVGEIPCPGTMLDIDTLEDLDRWS